MASSSSKVRELYFTRLKPVLRDIELVRRKVQTNASIAIGVGGVIVGLMLIKGRWESVRGRLAYIPPTMTSLQAITLIIAVIIALYFGAKAFADRNQYRADYKHLVVKEIVKVLLPGAIYKPYQWISQGVYEESRIYPDSVTDYRGDDLIECKINHTAFVMSELHTEYVQRSGKNKTRRTVFKGLFFYADFNKHIQGETFVFSDVAERILGKYVGQILQSAKINRPPVVKLENPEFENEFVVHSTDQQEARYILTPRMMEMILGMSKRIGKMPAIAFLNHKVFVAVPFHEDLFEPRIFGDPLSLSDLESVCAVIDLALGIVDDLDLNTRIWSKA